MYLTPTQTLIMIAAIACGTMFTRFLPFLLFPDGKQHPPLIDALARVLPPAMMGLLVVYCLKNIDVCHAPHGIPELAGILLVTLLHLYKRNILLSIGLGTVFYMLLVQKIFISG